MSTSKSIIKREKNRRYGKGKKSKTNPALAAAEPSESLDRFAGSSEEEDNEDDGDNDELKQQGIPDGKIDTAVEILPPVKPRRTSVAPRTTNDNDNDIDIADADADEYEGGNESESDEADNDDEDNDDQEIHDNEEDEEAESQFQITTGMANAMNRILSAPIKSKVATTEGTPATVVLSKTKTPLQIQAEKEKKIQETLKESRRVKRERQIKALHVPLTVATNSFAALNRNANATSSSLTRELEMERTHRRVATRGIVALFNAISHHQVKPEQTAVLAAAAAASSTATGEHHTNTTTASSSAPTKLTKNGFLDLIKQKAISSTTLYDGKTPKSVAVNTTTTTNNNNNLKGDGSDRDNAKKWNALKDEYMMDSSKNWDELDDDDDEDATNTDTAKSNHPAQQPRKKVRHDSRN